jgi:hypothetical protein
LPSITTLAVINQKQHYLTYPIIEMSQFPHVSCPPLIFIPAYLYKDIRKGGIKVSNERRNRDDNEGTIILNVDRVIIRANEIIVEDRDNKRRRRFDRDDVAGVSDQDEKDDRRRDFWI